MDPQFSSASGPIVVDFAGTPMRLPSAMDFVAETSAVPTIDTDDAVSYHHSRGGDSDGQRAGADGDTTTTTMTISHSTKMALFAATRSGDLIAVLRMLRYRRRLVVPASSSSPSSARRFANSIVKSDEVEVVPAASFSSSSAVSRLANTRLFAGSATPLLAAIAYGHLDIAAALIRLGGADVNARNGHGETALLMALRAHNEAQNRMEMPIDNDDDGWSGCLGVDLRFIQLLLSRGADVNGADNNGYTPLHAACHDDVLFDLMVARGANIHAQTRLGVTALFRVSNPRMASVLLKHGANPNHQDHRGETPLFYTFRPSITNYSAVEHAAARAAMGHNSDDDNANVNVNDDGAAANVSSNEGVEDNHLSDDDDEAEDTAVGATRGDADVDADEASDDDDEDHNHVMVRIFQCLIDGGANVNHRNTMGRTPLHTHCARLPLRDGIISAIIIATLLIAGADCTCTCVAVCGRSPLSFLGDVMVDHLMDELKRIGERGSGGAVGGSDTREAAADDDDDDETSDGLCVVAASDYVPRTAAAEKRAREEDNDGDDDSHDNYMYSSAVDLSATCGALPPATIGAALDPVHGRNKKNKSTKSEKAAAAFAVAAHIERTRADCNAEFHRNLHLFDAVEANDTKPIDDFIAKGGNVDVRDPYGCTLLSCAVHCGHAALTKRLLLGDNDEENQQQQHQYSDEKNPQNDNCHHPGHHSNPTTLSASSAACSAAATRRADVNAENYFRQSIVMTAATAGRADMLHLLADCGADVPNATPNFHSGEGPLACATSGPAIAALLSLGVDLTARNARGNTALGNAWCEVLVDQSNNLRGGGGGAANNNTNGNTNNSSNSTQTLKNNQKSRLARLEALLAAGADINERNCRQQTPLLRYLDRLRFDASQQREDDDDDDDGENDGNAVVVVNYSHHYPHVRPRSAAPSAPRRRRFGHPDAALIAALLDAGADTDVFDEYGRTPMALFEEHHGWEWDWAPHSAAEENDESEESEQQRYIVYGLLGGRWPNHCEEMLGLLVGDC